LAQLEAGQEAVRFLHRPPDVLAEYLKEHTEASLRFSLWLEYMDSLATGKEVPKLLMNAIPEPLSASITAP
jgi:hypothetical protein